MSRKLSDKDISDIIDKYQKDVSIIDLANEYNVDRSTIRKHLKSNGLQIGKYYYSRFSKQECEYILEMYLNNQWECIFNRYPYLSKQRVYSMASHFGYKKESYFWTQEDTDWLIQNYGVATKEEIMDYYGERHNYRSIRTKAGKLGLTQSQKWSSEEDEIFKKYYSSFPIDDVLKMLPKRTYNSLVCRGQKLGIYSYNYLNEKYSYEQKKFIQDNFGKLTDKEMAIILDKPVTGIQEQRQKMGLYIISKNYTKYESVAKLLRGHLQNWKIQSMASCDYKCVLTGSSNYAIHHVYSFNKIFEETMEFLEHRAFKISNNLDDYSKEELDYIINVFNKIHSKYPLGVCVRKDLHNLFHEIYGSGNNNEFQWEMFVERYKSGEFDTDR